jgi:hypothetical protein
VDQQRAVLNAVVDHFLFLLIQNPETLNPGFDFVAHRAHSLGCLESVTALPQPGGAFGSYRFLDYRQRTAAHRSRIDPSERLLAIRAVFCAAD